MPAYSKASPLALIIAALVLAGFGCQTNTDLRLPDENPAKTQSGQASTTAGANAPDPNPGAARPDLAYRSSLAVSMLEQCRVSSIELSESLGLPTSGRPWEGEEKTETLVPLRIEVNFTQGKVPLTLSDYGPTESRIFLICQHGKFTAGTEYDSYLFEDFGYNRGVDYTITEAVQNWGFNPDTAVRRYARFRPRDDAYLAIVFEYPSGSAASDLASFQKGKMPAALQRLWDLVEEISKTVKFIEPANSPQK